MITKEKRKETLQLAISSLRAGEAALPQLVGDTEEVTA